MALAAAFDEAKGKQRRVEGNPQRGNSGGILQTPFFGSTKTPEMPQAKFSQYDPSRFDGAHFHVVDQFQIAVRGRGSLGRHELRPYSIHFSRAYTPYGPLQSDPRSGMSFFVLRRYADSGSQRMPKEREKLRQVPNRDPWQITRPATFAALPAAKASMLEPVADIRDERGLGAYTLTMQPNARCEAPDPASSDGQYLVVLNGSLVHAGKTYAAPALVFVWPHEGPFKVAAGADGLQMLVLNFPRRQLLTASRATHAEATS